MKRIFLILALAATAGFIAAQDAEPSEALLTQMSRLEADAMDIRGLALDVPVKRVFPSRDDVVTFVAGQLDDLETQQYYRDAGLVYEAFDLLEPGTDIVAVLQDLLVAQIGGYYDPETKQMNTLLITGDELTDRLPLLEQIVYVHEFTHALQDANFDMQAFFGGEDDLAFSTQYPDEAQARLALVEGDATEVMTAYTLMLSTERPAEILQEMDALMGLVSTLEIPPGTPKILEQELTFPYLQGQVFVQRLVAEGGWELVNEAFRNPPVSTEHIINPSKYLSGDMPHKVEVMDVSMALGTGWEERFSRTAGEFFVRRYLETQLDAFSVARAAGGWGGDTYRFYVNAESHAAAWVWKLSWDSTADATQFYEAMLRFMAQRYPTAVPEFSLCWSGSADTMCMAQPTPDTVVITKAPLREQASSMRDAAANN